MVNMFGMIVGATLIPLVYWFLRTIVFYSGVSEAAPGYRPCWLRGSGSLHATYCTFVQEE